MKIFTDRVPDDFCKILGFELADATRENETDRVARITKIVENNIVALDKLKVNGYFTTFVVNLPDINNLKIWADNTADWASDNFTLEEMEEFFLLVFPNSEHEEIRDGMKFFSEIADIANDLLNKEGYHIL